jgi:3-oxoacyl-[acyl-carrier-protein] synthase II
VRRAVVVTGVGAVTPLGVGAETLHARWRAGESGIVDGVGRCADFDPRAQLGTKEARRADRFGQLALAAGEEALRAARWPAGGPYEPTRVGCAIGTGIGGIGTFEEQHAVLHERGAGRVSPLTAPRLMPNAAAALLSIRHDLRGPSYCVASACAAGAHAIGAAARMIAHGEADAVVAGGAEAALARVALLGFGRMEAISRSGVCRPFDRRRDGFVPGEGAGILVLEEEQAAVRRGAPIAGRVLGYGATCDAHHLTAPEPSGRGARQAIELALADAGIGPEGVDHVNAHGTATLRNDRAETLAIKAALGPAATRVPVSSAKSAIGHLLGAAGAVEAIAALLALRDRIVAPTLNHEQPEDGCDLDVVAGRPRPLVPRGGRRLVALSSSFGFGGHNVVLCLGAA